MRSFANGAWLKTAAWSIALVIVGLNVRLVSLTVSKWLESAGRYRTVLILTIVPVLIGLLFTPMVALIATGIAISSKYGTPSIYNPGPQGFSETLYAYVSQANNNGSAFAGYTGFVQPNAPGNFGSYGITFADILGGLSMLTARFVPLLSALAIAGSLSVKRIVPAGPGTFRTDNPTFVVLLLSVIVVVAALTFFPAVLLGPVVQGLTNQLFS
jgi:K+-transporting ATPase ATPase A chain